MENTLFLRIRKMNDLQDMMEELDKYMEEIKIQREKNFNELIKEIPLSIDGKD